MPALLRVAAASRRGRPRLLRQPGGFEGLCAGREEHDSHDLSTPDCPYARHSQLDLNPTRSAPRSIVDDRDHPVAGIDQLLYLVIQLFPGLVVAAQKAPGPLVA